MKDLKNAYYLYLDWPCYLAQWYAHEMYRLAHCESEHQEPFFYNCNKPAVELDPVHTRRGSAERNILETCLCKQPDRIPELPSKTATICVVIPNFLNKPASTYNYLNRSSKHLLQRTVFNHFRLELTKYMNKNIFNAKTERAGYKPPIELLLEAFMELNGIEYNETNLESVKKIWRRLYNNHYKNTHKDESTRD